MNPNDTPILDRLLRHDRDTTLELIEIATRLETRALERDFEIGPGSVRRTLDHIVRAMECWTDLMLAKPQRERLSLDAPLADLAARLHAVGDELLALGKKLATEGRLDHCFVDTLDDPPKEKTFGGALVHVATHGMHHRAQVLFMLRQLGVEGLPEGDALGWENRRR